MRRLVTNRLRLSRTTRNSSPTEDVDFNELVSEVTNTLGYAINDKHAIVKKQPDLPTMHCDRVRVNELFQNLISNAIKFTNAHRPVINIGYRFKNGEHLFWVQDNGVGIAKEDHRSVFHAFHRLDNSSTTESNGLGLTICKRIVERHDGRIWVESELGYGSRFCFTLTPRPPAEASDKPANGEGQDG